MVQEGRQEWGRHVRSSPQSCPELLQELNQFIPPWEAFDMFGVSGFCLEPVDFYDVVQWLKVSCCRLLAASHC